MCSMGAENWLRIDVSQLQVGLPLRYDVYSESGDLLALSGEEFTRVLKEAWTGLGFSSVCVDLGQASEDDEFSQPYNPRVLKRLSESLEMATEVVMSLAVRIQDGAFVTSSEFQELTDRIVEDVRTDSAAALLTFSQANAFTATEHDLMLADRCSRQSLLSVIIAYELGMSSADCHLAGTAGLLHDISLMGLPSDLGEDELAEFYRQHPIKSAVQIEGIVGINPRIPLASAQVHESPRGNGFPRGLQSNRIMPVAKVINLADTYITLTAQTQPAEFPPARRFHPADAIGYIMYHTTRGQFGLDAVKALIRSTSLYPVGSKVLLSDQSSAVVFRSSKIAPSRPLVVRGPNKSLLDLRQSNLAIVGPDRQSQGELQPMKRSQLAEVYWL